MLKIQKGRKTQMTPQFNRAGKQRWHRNSKRLPYGGGLTGYSEKATTDEREDSKGRWQDCLTVEVNREQRWKRTWWKDDRWTRTARRFDSRTYVVWRALPRTMMESPLYGYRKQGEWQIKMSTMIVQHRPGGLAEGECRYRFSEYEGRRRWDHNAHAKQPGCRAKVISNSVLAWCHFGGKSWYEFYLPMVVKVYVETRYICGEWWLVGTCFKW